MVQSQHPPTHWNLKGEDEARLIIVHEIRPIWKNRKKKTQENLKGEERKEVQKLNRR
jgi:hypothetical protein